MNDKDLSRLMKSADESYLAEAFADSYEKSQKPTAPIITGRRRANLKWLAAAAVFAVGLTAVILPFAISNGGGDDGLPDSDVIISSAESTTAKEKPQVTTAKETEKETTAIKETTNAPETTTVTPAEPAPIVTAPPVTEPPESAPPATARPPETTATEVWTVPDEKPENLENFSFKKSKMDYIIGYDEKFRTEQAMEQIGGTHFTGDSAASVPVTVTDREKNLKIHAAFSDLVFAGKILDVTTEDTIESGLVNVYKISIDMIYKDSLSQANTGSYIYLPVTYDEWIYPENVIGDRVVVFAESDGNGGYRCTYDKSIAFSDFGRYYMFSRTTFFEVDELTREFN